MSYVTGTSVVAIAFEGGVVVAADTLISYGSMARFLEVNRIEEINKHLVVSSSGDYADHQHMSFLINEKQIKEEYWGSNLEPAALHSWITRVAYQKRSKMDPFLCTWIVAGLQKNSDTGILEPFLGCADRIGTQFRSNVICTSLGQYIATPFIREITEKFEGKLPSEQQAMDMIVKCMETLYHRDARSFSKYYVSIVKAEGVKTVGPVETKGRWEIAKDATY